MKCPICGQELTLSKKDPNYLLCYNCRKKFRVPQKQTAAQTTTDEDEDEEPVQKYSNIPPKAVREKQEREVRRGYDEMVSSGQDTGKRKSRKSRQRQEERYDDEYDDDYDDEEEHVSMAPVIILGIAIVVVLGLIIYMLLQ